MSFLKAAFYIWMYLLISVIFLSCSTPSESTTDEEGFILTLLAPEKTNINFKNTIPENFETNVLTNTNYYNGAGVAIGDINNDGLVDIYFNANKLTGKLYINKGNLEFKDITKDSGLDSISGWKTGVTMVDINQDGYLDIYICRSGKLRPIDRANLLYINNGDETFTEKAKEYGLNSWATSTQANFFDYDLDGDLDMYLLNHSLYPIYELYKNFGDDDIDPYIGDKLFINDNGYFTEKTEFIGIRKSKLGDGLGIGISDFNNNGFQDIYVANDFSGRDYMYFNKGDSTFNETAHQSLEHMSFSSMGMDIADINNDGWQDFFVLDMRSMTNYDRKTNMGAMDVEAFHKLIELGGHYQYMQNVLQLNNGNSTFSDIATLSGLSTTDWSWSPLFVDLDNDGYKDIFITNGMRRNTTNKDYQHYKDERIAEELKKKKPNEKQMVSDILDKMPTIKAVNLVYKNIDGLNFEKQNESWGVTLPTYSNGAAYADLDNDGDMDLVVNNIDEVAHIYRNNATSLNKNNFLKVKLNGSTKNRNGIGAKIMIQTGDKQQFLEQHVTRGYESSVDYTLHFGLGEVKSIDKLIVTWADGKESSLQNLDVNKTISVDYTTAIKASKIKENTQVLFTEKTEDFNVNHKHIENDYDDFKKEVLLPHKMSTFGPSLAVGDINNDGLDDFYIGGAMGFEGAVYTQNENTSFTKTKQQSIRLDKEHEDMDAIFFDADKDGDLDLYVVSGGNEKPQEDDYYQDRLYLNNGKGAFTKSAKALPKMNASGGVVRPFDFDSDGDLDLFVGGRLKPGQYPKSDASYLLENNNGKFTDVTTKKANAFKNLGMVTDAIWSDYDGDEIKDLVLVGEWMPITIFKNNKKTLTKVTNDSTLNNSGGWWFSIAEGDVNLDGRMDYIVGNLGQNYKYKAKPGNPFRLYSKDFDNNGSLDIVLSYFENDTLYPLRGKSCSSQQIPTIKKKFKNYDAFGSASLTDVYGKTPLKDSNLYEVKTFATSILLNTTTGFQLKPLPFMAQISAVFGIVYDDFDQDGIHDIVIAGNLYNAEIETPRADASKGLFLKGNGKGDFKTIMPYDSGLFIPGDIKKLKSIHLGDSSNNKKGLISAENNGYVKLFETK